MTYKPHTPYTQAQLPSTCVTNTQAHTHWIKCSSIKRHPRVFPGVRLVDRGQTCSNAHMHWRSHRSRRTCIFTQLSVAMRPFIHTYTHRHIHTQRLSADCNEMSNQLCQIACLPEGEERGGVCAKSAHLLLLLFPFFFSPLTFSSLVSLAALAKGGGESGTLFPPRATEQRGASARISRLLSTLASSLWGYIWGRAAYGRPPPHLDPEKKQMRRERWGGSVRFWRTAAYTRRPCPNSSELTRCVCSRSTQTSTKY